jgi:hypothetical protein
MLEAAWCQRPSLGTLGDHVLGALLPGPDHVDEELARLLQVGRDDADAFAGRITQAGLDCRRLAEIPRQLDDPDPLAAARLRLQQELDRPVGRAVVDEDELELVPGKRGAQGKQPRDGLGQVRLILVHRHDQ